MVLMLEISVVFYYKQCCYEHLCVYLLEHMWKSFSKINTGKWNCWIALIVYAHLGLDYWVPVALRRGRTNSGSLSRMLENSAALSPHQGLLLSDCTLCHLMGVQWYSVGLACIFLTATEVHSFHKYFPSPCLPSQGSGLGFPPPQYLFPFVSKVKSR